MSAPGRTETDVDLSQIDPERSDEPPESAIAARGSGQQLELLDR